MIILFTFKILDTNLSLKYNTFILYNLTNNLLLNRNNQYLIKLLFNIIKYIKGLGFKSQLKLIGTDNIYKTGFRLKFESTQPISVEFIYFYIWYTLIDLKEFNDIGDKIIFISKGRAESNTDFVKLTSFHSNFYWNNDMNYLDFFNNYIPKLEHIQNSAYFWWY